MAEIHLKHIFKNYDKHTSAVKDFDLHIKDKEFIVLVGPSGCGKSTTLRMIAGLEKISEGDLIFNSKRVNDVEPKDRDIAMVFQNYALYPHMTVYHNMAFGLHLQKVPKETIKKRVLEAAEILGLEPYLNRKPKALSGGQRQRVALGRAIVRNAQVFLMDEPLSNLDAKLRVQMRAEIIKLHQRIQNTTIYVTHDQTEAMTMASRIVVMKDGVIQQVGTPKEIYETPNNMFVGGFIGSPAMNFIPAEVTDRGLKIGGSIISLQEGLQQKLKDKLQGTNEVTFGIRPEHLTPFDPSKDNDYMEVVVEVSELLGAETIIYCKLNGTDIISRISPDIDVEVGGTIKLALNVNKGHFFSSLSEERIHL
ncbi:ABC transporter ATP-binding protein [Sutcliffiella horikoshii]|uniref:sn-glycerol-3-phosphate ABC transporter ATP-binding protein UgpC n=1 Tax=Sutcliffiella horikoshii TaxID=79883 RepID=A0A5D4T913_9BACI|nr:sn-glycerol-3-phosphate ABC transporter ATP-binding protein UgpC [Sutcliffiella horikoshii]TYS71769.1 sn-glycerol-3-phosphate ABC transporter ATP-binding protein UgpC [Sutcliffiella horikoshii]